MFERELLDSKLRSGIVTVTFTKKDGSERIMRCTLSPDLTATYEKKTERTKTPNEGVCAVFDVDVKEWRSFRYDSIKEVKYED